MTQAVPQRETAFSLPKKNSLQVTPVDSKLAHETLAKKHSLTLEKGQVVAVGINAMRNDELPEEQRGTYLTGPAQTLTLPDGVMVVAGDRSTGIGVNSNFKEYSTMSVYPITPEGVAAHVQVGELNTMIDTLDGKIIAAAARQKGVDVQDFMMNALHRTEYEAAQRQVREDAMVRALEEQLAAQKKILFAEKQKASIVLGEKLGLIDPDGAKSGIKSDNVANLDITIPLK